MNAICQLNRHGKTSIRTLRQTVRFSLIAVSALTLLLGTANRAIANPEAVTPETVAPETVALETTSDAADPADIEEINTSITQDYMPAIVYLPDPNTQELVPQSVLVTADEPVAGAVTQIVESYEGQDVGITGYEVSVDEAAKQAEINFAVNNPRGGRAFQSLSSANQYCLFEAIRETLLTQPAYGIQQVIFQANSVDFDI
ncbi:hypothetical protein [Leptolyngbya sp. O-77]|uniref:hypothetical protein n=1 Tax=Leptolyngbya sp. O-77 TaxID=1080068 RepID=UPI00074D4AD6|nr:hypothetical protein [Leptolyngbya sp. O-77]BAU41349.1 hypothetical protein O77CONTIG1_01158 [Leptolyngbya sp. O-77]